MRKPQARLLRPQEYAMIAAEEFGWKCESCNKFTEEGVEGRYCRYCAEYWEDVRNGLFDRYDNDA